MKKIFTLALASIMLFSCSKEEIWTAQETGQMTINVEQGPQIEVTTKNTTEPDPIDAYTVNIKQDTDIKVTDTYGDVKIQTFAFPVGDYTVEAYNITADEAAPTDGNGSVRYYGFQNVTVKANTKSDVDFTCTMANSKVTFVFDASFWSAFLQSADEVYVTASSTGDQSGRNISFKDASAHASATPAFFTVGALNYTITAVRKSDNATKSFGGTETLEAAKWHQFTVKASSGNGQIGDWDIDVDVTCNPATSNIVVNPYDEQEQEQEQEPEQNTTE